MSNDWHHLFNLNKQTFQAQYFKKMNKNNHEYLGVRDERGGRYFALLLCVKEVAWALKLSSDRISTVSWHSWNWKLKLFCVTAECHDIKTKQINRLTGTAQGWIRQIFRLIPRGERINKTKQQLQISRKFGKLKQELKALGRMKILKKKWKL